MKKLLSLTLILSILANPVTSVCAQPQITTYLSTDIETVKQDMNSYSIIEETAHINMRDMFNEKNTAQMTMNLRNEKRSDKPNSDFKPSTTLTLRGENYDFMTKYDKYLNRNYQDGAAVLERNDSYTKLNLRPINWPVLTFEHTWIDQEDDLTTHVIDQTTIINSINAGYDFSNIKINAKHSIQDIDNNVSGGVNSKKITDSTDIKMNVSPHKTVDISSSYALDNTKTDSSENSSKTISQNIDLGVTLKPVKKVFFISSLNYRHNETDSVVNWDRTESIVINFYPKQKFILSFGQNFGQRGGDDIVRAGSQNTFFNITTPVFKTLDFRTGLNHDRNEQQSSITSLANNGFISLNGKLIPKINFTVDYQITASEDRSSNTDYLSVKRGVSFRMFPTRRSTLDIDYRYLDTLAESTINEIGNNEESFGIDWVYKFTNLLNFHTGYLRSRNKSNDIKTTSSLFTSIDWRWTNTARCIMGYYRNISGGFDQTFKAELKFRIHNNLNLIIKGELFDDRGTNLDKKSLSALLSGKF